MIQMHWERNREKNLVKQKERRVNVPLGTQQTEEFSKTKTKMKEE